MGVTKTGNIIMRSTSNDKQKKKKNKINKANKQRLFEIFLETSRAACLEW